MNFAKPVIFWLGALASRTRTLLLVFTMVTAMSPTHAFAGDGPSGASEPVVRSIRQYWELSAAQKRQPQAYEIHGYVTYYDPAWRLLFVQDDSGWGAYVPLAPANAFPFKAGQRLLISGRYAAADDNFSLDGATLAVEGSGYPEPVDMVRRLGDSGQFVSKFVTLEGVVDHYRRLSPRHLEMTLSVEGKAVVAWLQRELTDSLPDLTDANVRITGVYNPQSGPEGSLQYYSVLIPEMRYLQVLGHLDTDSRFTRAAQPISALAKLPAGQLVRIVGEVKAQEAGHFVTIRDRTGQIDVMTAQSRPCAINETIEAIGYASIQGTDWKLTEGIFRPAPAGADKPAITPAAKSEPLRLAAQVLDLTPEEANEGRPVTLTAVVTWSNPNSPFFFVQDASGGVCVMRGKSTSVLRSIGRNVQIHGTTGMGQFSPVVVANDFDKVSELVLPQAKQISLEHALSGVEEARWVEMRGYLRRINTREGLSELEIATSGGDFIAVLPAGENVADLAGAVVRLHGVCTASADEQRRLTGIKLWVPSAGHVQVEEPAPKNPFDVPLRSLASLGQFGNLQSFTKRVRVTGVVLHHVLGHLIYLQNGDDALPVFSRETVRLQPGDRIETVGFLGRQGGRIGLREAVYRKTGVEPQPVPKPILIENEPAAAEDGRLVKLEGTLIDSSATGGQLRLTLQAPNTVFEAYLEAGEARGVEEIENGSRLALTGVYEVKFDEYAKPSAFQINLRTARDVVILQRPSWFTRQRILAFAGTLALGTLIFMAWVASLRRRVKAQTGQIREQVQRESWLKDELQRAGKIESLGLLAGGIAHDFNNLLTVMMGNLSLVRLDRALTRDSVEALHSAERAALRARDLTQQLLTFSKGGAPIRTAVSLPEIVREVAEFALRGSKTRCEFDLSDDLWPANVDKGQIGQVVQNVVINAMQAMAEGGQIKISLRNTHVGDELREVLMPGRYLLLSITDHGPGIRAADLQHIFDPYFTTKKTGNGLGLATVYSIVKKHLGHISAESTPGRETKFKIWLPAADGAPAGPEPARKPASSAPVNDKVTVLFMDDEETIRNLGRTLLSRMGYVVVTTCDGAETIREYKRACEAKCRYDLVILDLTIPGGMGGRETMEELLKVDPGVRAIVSSGYSNDLVLANYHAHGFRGMISKPYEIADFSHAIEQVLRGVRA